MKFYVCQCLGQAPFIIWHRWFDDIRPIQIITSAIHESSCLRNLWINVKNLSV